MCCPWSCGRESKEDHPCSLGTRRIGRCWASNMLPFYHKEWWRATTLKHHSKCDQGTEMNRQRKSQDHPIKNNSTHQTQGCWHMAYRKKDDIGNCDSCRWEKVSHTRMKSHFLCKFQNNVNSDASLPDEMFGKCRIIPTWWAMLIRNTADGKLRCVPSFFEWKCCLKYLLYYSCS